MRLWSGKGWWGSYVLYSQTWACVWDVWRHVESFRGSESTLLGLLCVVQLSHFKLDKWTVTSLFFFQFVFFHMCFLWVVHVHLFDIPAFFCNSMHHHLLLNIIMWRKRLRVLQQRQWASVRCNIYTRNEMKYPMSDSFLLCLLFILIKTTLIVIKVMPDFLAEFEKSGFDTFLWTSATRRPFYSFYLIFFFEVWHKQVPACIGSRQAF